MATKWDDVPLNPEYMDHIDDIVWLRAQYLAWYRLGYIRGELLEELQSVETQP